MEFPDDLLLDELSHLELYNNSLFQSNFSAYNETDALLPTGVKVTIVVVYMIVCVIGLVGNFLVMYVIISSLTVPDWSTGAYLGTRLRLDSGPP
eukprot:superscaffoldBa00001782_g11994